jgi:putative FmdB family regulatory protein
MPLYEYQCDACGERFEIIQKFSDEPIETCRQCAGGPVRRLLSSPAIQFKGSGWYITDYAQKGKPAESGDGAKPEASKAEGGKKTDSTEAGKTGSKGGEATAGAARPASTAKSDPA